MPKIVAIGMVKNEADIIESFVRHTLTFADELLIIDHLSCDNTLKILELLAKEGLPLIIRHLYRPERFQFEVTNQLMKEAIEERGADYVIPLDTDEFLVNIDGDRPVRDVIAALPPDGVYKLRWQRFMPAAPDEDADKFILRRPALRQKAFDPGNKILFPVAHWRKKPYEIGEGSHYVRWRLVTPTGANFEIVPEKGFVDKLVLAHYHRRSVGQYSSKMAVGWLSLSAMHGRDSMMGKGYKRAFDDVANGDAPRDYAIEQQADEYVPWTWDKKTAGLELRYGELAKINVLKNILGMAEDLAARIAEGKTRALGKTVSVILTVPAAYGDTTALRPLLERTLSALAAAGREYPLADIAVIMDDDRSWQLAREIAQACGLAEIMKPLGATGDIAAALGAAVTGDYVQWLSPGDEIAHDKLIRQVTALTDTVNYLYGDLAAVAALGMPATSKDIRLYFLLAVRDPMEIGFCKELSWDEYLANGRPIYGGLAGLLIQRDLMARLGWFGDCFDGGRIYVLNAWQRLWQAIECIGLIPACMVKVTAPAARELENICWWQIERKLMLDMVKADVPRDIKTKLLRMEESNFTGVIPQLIHLAGLNGVEPGLLRELANIYAVGQN